MTQFAMLGLAKFMHLSRRTLCRGFVSCGQQPPAEQVMRHNITCQMECTCQVTCNFVDPFEDIGLVLSGAGLLILLPGCFELHVCTLRLFASPRTLRLAVYI